MLGFGDVISIKCSNGYLASAAEPLAENSDVFSNLRVISPADLYSGESLPANFSQRCLFRIVGEGGQYHPEHDDLHGSDGDTREEKSFRKLRFGMHVRLLAVPSDNTLMVNAKLSIPFLQKTVSADEGACACWCILPRYRVHNEGDYINVGSAVYLRNNYCKMNLTMSTLTQSLGFDRLVGLSPSSESSHWEILLWLRNKTFIDRSITKALVGGDYVRLLHKESGGVLSLATCTSAEDASEASRQMSLCITSDSEDASCLGLWQILPSFVGRRAATDELGILHPDEPICLLHVVSGAYLRLCDLSEYSQLARQTPSMSGQVKKALCAGVGSAGSSTFIAMSAQFAPATLFFGSTCYFVCAVSGELLRHLGATDAHPHAEMYRIESVPMAEIKDILYLLRHIRLARATTAYAQFTIGDGSFMQIYRHFAASMDGLRGWIGAGVDEANDASELPPSTVASSAPFSSIPAVSSQYPWLGLLESPFLGDSEKKHRHVGNLHSAPSIFTARNDRSWLSFAGEHNANAPEVRPAALSNEIPSWKPRMFLRSGLFYELRRFCSVAFVQCRSAYLSQSTHRPILLEACIRLVHQLFTDLVSTSISFCPPAAKDIQSDPGNIVCWIAETSFGLDPPLRELLSQNDSSIELVDVVGPGEITALMGQMRNLWLANDPLCLHILRILTALCVPAIDSTKFSLQDLITAAFDESFCVESRPVYDEAAGANSPSTGTSVDPCRWEVVVDARLEGAMEVFPMSDDIDPSESSNVLTNRSTEEILLYLYHRRVQSSPAKYLSIRRALLLLADLRLGGSLLCSEAIDLVGASPDSFVDWFQKRGVFILPVLCLRFATMDSRTFYTVVDPIDLDTTDNDLTFDFVEHEMHTLLYLTVPGCIMPLSSIPVVHFPEATSEKNYLCTSTPIFSGKSWVDWKHALDGEDTGFLQQLLVLFTSMCRNKNIVAQSMVGNILPAELLLYLLSLNVSMTGKKILLEVLSAVYINHDLVFSCLMHKDARFCGIDSGTQVPPVVIGKVFASISRVRGHGAPDGLTLRKKLFLFMTTELQKLSLNVDDMNVLQYNDVFLQIVLDLVRIGFWEDAAGLMVPVNDRDSKTVQSMHFFKLENPFVQKLDPYEAQLSSSLDRHIVETVMVVKLNECISHILDSDLSPVCNRQRSEGQNRGMSCSMPQPNYFASRLLGKILCTVLLILRECYESSIMSTVTALGQCIRTEMNNPHLSFFSKSCTLGQPPRRLIELLVSTTSLPGSPVHYLAYSHLSDIISKGSHVRAILEKLIFVPTSEEALFRRLVDIFHAIFRKYADSAVSDSQSASQEVATLALDCTKSMLYHFFNRRANNAAVISPHHVQSLYDRVKARVKYYLTACADGFRDKDAQAEYAKEIAALAQQQLFEFSPRKQAKSETKIDKEMEVDEILIPPLNLVDIPVHMMEFAVTATQLLQEIQRRDCFGEMTKQSRLIFEETSMFLALLFHNSPSLALKLFYTINSVAIEYAERGSIGASVLLEALCRHCSRNFGSERSKILQMLKVQLRSWHDKEIVCAAPIKILAAILSSRFDSPLRRETAVFLLHNGREAALRVIHRGFKFNSSIQRSPQNEAYAFALDAIAAYCTLGDENVHQISVWMPMQHCMDVLASHESPLFIKQNVLKITSVIYGQLESNISQFAEYLLVDLRRIAHSNFEHYIPNPSCDSFVIDGALDALFIIIPFDKSATVDLLLESVRQVDLSCLLKAEPNAKQTVQYFEPSTKDLEDYILHSEIFQLLPKLHQQAPPISDLYEVQLRDCFSAVFRIVIGDSLAMLFRLPAEMRISTLDKVLIVFAAACVAFKSYSKEESTFLLAMLNDILLQRVSYDMKVRLEADERNRVICDVGTRISSTLFDGSSAEEHMRVGVKVLAESLSRDVLQAISEMESHDFETKSSALRKDHHRNNQHPKGIIMKNLITFLREHPNEFQIQFLMLPVVGDILRSSIDLIRYEAKDLKERLKRIASETSRLGRIQEALCRLGGTQLIAALLQNDVNSDGGLKLFCLALELAVRLMKGRNKIVQHQFCRISSTPGLNYPLAIQYVLRAHSFKLGNIMSAKMLLVAPGLRDDLRVDELIFSFLASLCSGHNERSRHFLREQNDRGASCVNLVEDAGRLTHSLSQAASKLMLYINHPTFCSLLAPRIPDTPDRRRMIAWHDSRSDFDLLSHIMAAASAGFIALAEMCQGPCLENRPYVLLATCRCQSWLEFVGCLQINAATDVYATTAANCVPLKSILSQVQGGKRTVVWRGGSPRNFYRKYAREMSLLECFGIDPDRKDILQCLTEWERGGGGNVTNTILRGGIDLKTFKDAACRLHHSCLRMLLALLEASNDAVAHSISMQLRPAILMQNFDHLVGKPGCEEISVEYLTLLSTLASINRADNILSMQERLKSRIKSRRGGTKIASVEIVAGDGRLQRVYFPTPAFVTKYWSYPETQKAMDALIHETSRQSPEETLSGLFQNTQGIILVMRRQEILRSVLGTAVHALFGGKGTGYYLISLRSSLLLLSFLLNVYYASLSAFAYSPPADDELLGVVALVLQNDLWAICIRALAYVHLGLTVSLVARQALNSRAFDDVDLNALRVDILATFRQIIRFLLDILWPLILMTFSGLALQGFVWFYAPVLLDLVAMSRFMTFLIIAVGRNSWKIIIALILTTLLLYLFAVVTYLFLGDQYAFNSHSSCQTDVLSCFKLHVDYGLQNAPNWLGNSYIDAIWDFGDYDLNTTHLGRLGALMLGTLYTILYIILINLVLQAIITGLIVDTFSTMRQESEDIEEAIQNRCFICSISRDEFDAHGISFDTHIEEEHNLAMYIWFRVHLDTKDPHSFTGPEHYADEMYKDRKNFLHLMPIRTSMSLEKATQARDHRNTGTN